MAIITLLTDFGLSDNYAGIMKGVICTICPDATIIDITHQVPPQDIEAAAYSLQTAYRFFPRDTIHLVVVDPGVGGQRRIIAARTARGIFIAPDNGILGPVLDEEPVDAVVVVENADLFLHPVSRTFHGRDIFAPVAAHLALNGDLDLLGSRIPPRTIVRMKVDAPEIMEDGSLQGTIIAVDRFGNLITNIGIQKIAAIFGSPEVMRIVVDIKGKRVAGISEIYQSVAQGAPLALIGSGGMLEISVNGGSAGAYFNASRGDKIRLYCET